MEVVNLLQWQNRLFKLKLTAGLKDPKRLKTFMNREVEIANLWLKANNLTINAAKCSPLVIIPGVKAATLKPKIFCDGRPIAVNNTVKYVRLWLTKTLII